MAKAKLAGGNGKQYRTDIGGKRFYLGFDAGAAEERKVRLLKLWATIVSETIADAARSDPFDDPALQRGYVSGNPPQWNTLALKIAEGIRQGDTTIAFSFTDQDEIKYREQIDTYNKKYAAIITFVAEDQNAYKFMDDVKEYAATKKTGITPIADAVAAFQKYIAETKIDQDTGKSSEWALHLSQQVGFALQHLPEGTNALNQLNFNTLERWAIAISNRPTSARGTVISPTYARHVLKALRVFIKWTSKNFKWSKPEDWGEAIAQRVKHTTAEKAGRTTKVKTMTYTPEEIATLYRYASPKELAYMMTALCTGAGAMECSTIRKVELHRQDGKVILKRHRTKSAVYGEWQLWPQAVAAIDAVADNMKAGPYLFCKENGDRLIWLTDAGRCNKIAEAWNRLNARIQKDQPTFRALSFNKLRKTAAAAIRRIAGGEVASMLLCHGQATSDDQLEAYADRDFNALFDAQAKYLAELEPYLAAEPIKTRTMLPISKIEAIKDMWRAGKKPAEISEATGASRATIYRYQTSQTAKK
jgi:hypothetical protein